jgi:hypothetical protein
VRDATGWSAQDDLQGSNTGSGDQFGSDLALSDDGDTLAVGARGEASGATDIDGDQTDDSAVHAGAVYVFGRDGQSWSQHAYVKASNTSEQDNFGWMVALSNDGNTMAVGAYLEDELALDAGAVYVFGRDGDSWSQHASVKASNAGEDDQFGYSVALSGDGEVLAVGAIQERSGAVGINGDQSPGSAQNGAVYVFGRDGESWAQRAYVKAPQPVAAVGWSLSLSADGTTLAVGAPQESGGATNVGGQQVDNSTPQSGAVYLY